MSVGPGEHPMSYGGGWLFSGITREGVVAPDLSRQPSLLLYNALTGLGICSELAFGLYALTTMRE